MKEEQKANMEEWEKSPEVETLRLFFQQEEDTKIRRLVFLLAQEMVGCGEEELMELLGIST